MLWVFSQYPSLWSPYFPMESRRKFKEQTLLSRKNLCNILSSCKFNWFLTVLTLEENLNFKDWSSSLHHLWLICEHHEKNGTWKPPSFCIHIPFLSLTPLFFTLSLYYKIANSRCCHAPSNHLGVHNTLTFITWVSFWNWPCSQAGLCSPRCWDTAKHDQSAGYHQLCPTHGQISPKGGTDILPHPRTAHCWSCPSVLVFIAPGELALSSLPFIYLFIFKIIEMQNEQGRGEMGKGELSARGPAEWGWWPDFKHTGGILWPL